MNYRGPEFIADERQVTDIIPQETLIILMMDILIWLELLVILLAFMMWEVLTRMVVVTLVVVSVVSHSADAGPDSQQRPCGLV